MSYRLLYVLVEGRDDERFFQRLIEPRLAEKYDRVQLWKYAQQKRERVTGFIKSIGSMDYAEYLYVSDLDQAPCVTMRKQHILGALTALDQTRVIVVRREIEGWYLACLDEETCSKLGFEARADPDQITKEQFNDLMPPRFTSRIDFMQEILSLASLQAGSRRNASLRYFLARHDCEPS